MFKHGMLITVNKYLDFIKLQLGTLPDSTKG